MARSPGALEGEVGFGSSCAGVSDMIGHVYRTFNAFHSRDGGTPLERLRGLRGSQTPRTFPFGEQCEGRFLPSVCWTCLKRSYFWTFLRVRHPETRGSTPMSRYHVLSRLLEAILPSSTPPHQPWALDLHTLRKYCARPLFRQWPTGIHTSYHLTHVVHR